MKSDREFLNGVYEKAEELTKEKEKNTQGAMLKLPKGMLAAAIALIIVIPISLRLNSGYISSREGQTRISSVKEGPRAFQGSSHEESPLEELDFLKYLVEVSQVVLSAKVIGAEERVLFQVIELYKGELNAKEFTLEDSEQLEFLEGEEVLLFLNTHENKSLRLNEGYDSKYTFTKFRNGEKIFISQHGSEASIEIIKSIISGGFEN